MIFQVIIAVSEFKDKSNSYYHSRVLSLTKGIDKYELSGWVYNDVNLPGNPGIWKITVEKSGKDFKIIESKLVYEIGLLR